MTTHHNNTTPQKSSATTLRAVLTPAALKKMEALRKAGTLTAQQKKEQREQQARRQKFRKTLTWLQKTFPDCFNADQPKPLKIRIELDLFEKITEHPEFSRLNMRKALAYYTSRLKYHESFLTQTHRVDLNGNPVDEITDPQRAHAQEAINAIQARLANQANPAPD